MCKSATLTPKRSPVLASTGCESDTLHALLLPLLSRDRPGNRGGLVTAYGPPAVDQQTHPGDRAPNWADTSAATEASAPRRGLNPGGGGPEDQEESGR